MILWHHRNTKRGFIYFLIQKVKKSKLKVNNNRNIRLSNFLFKYKIYLLTKNKQTKLLFHIKRRKFIILYASFILHWKWNERNGIEKPVSVILCSIEQKKNEFWGEKNVFEWTLIK